MPEESGTWNGRGEIKPMGQSWKEQEAVWEALLPCQGQGNCGGLQFSAWRWNCKPQYFLPSSGPKKFIFFSETHILV